MYSVFEASFYQVREPFETLVPMIAQAGMGGVNVPVELLENPAGAPEAAALVRGYGLRWGLLPTPVDFYAEATGDAQFEAGLESLKRWAETGERMGVKRCYNHVVNGSSLRPFPENYEWHLRRIGRVARVLRDHGIGYGLEFVGPATLRNSFRYPFVNTIAGVSALADEAGGGIGFLFDTYHWYCGGGRLDDLYFALAHADRMIAFHINDGVAGRGREEQRDLERAMPMTTGVVDALTPYRLFWKRGYDGPVICEPMSPSYERFAEMEPAAVVRELGEAYARMERLAREAEAAPCEGGMSG